jgi:hypothetical protein
MVIQIRSKISPAQTVADVTAGLDPDSQIGQAEIWNLNNEYINTQSG